VLVIILCLASDAWALDSATTTGFAGAVRANPTVASVHESAPATMSLGQNYVVGATGGLSQFDELGFRLEGMDSETASFAMGISYVRDTTNYPTTDANLPGWKTPDEDVSSDQARNTDFAIGLAMGWAKDLISAGATLHRYSTKATYAEDGVSWNVGVGVGSKLGEQVTVSLTGMNVLPIDDEPFTLALAGRVAPSDIASLEVDVLSDFTSNDQPTFGASVGGEMYLLSFLPIRAGFEHDATFQKNAIGFGFGAKDTTSGATVQYGFHAPVGDGPFTVWGTETWHTLEINAKLK
jgi:hypothetical protein